MNLYGEQNVECSMGIPLHRPYIGLIYGRYLQFRFQLKCWTVMFHKGCTISIQHIMFMSKCWFRQHRCSIIFWTSNGSTKFPNEHRSKLLASYSAISLCCEMAMSRLSRATRPLAVFCTVRGVAFLYKDVAIKNSPPVWYLFECIIYNLYI